MTTTLLIRPRAEIQLRQAYDWYEEKRKGLGKEFLLSVESVFLIIEKKPLLFQTKYKNIRCALLPKFPYGVFYIVDKKKIVVLSVFHLSRHPKLWKFNH